MAAGLTGWLLTRTTRLEQVLLITAGLLLLYPEPLYDFIGMGLFIAALLAHWLRRRSTATGAPQAP
jgi:TRAP-type uncharacterized transport system fused permease subunit